MPQSQLSGWYPLLPPLSRAFLLSTFAFLSCYSSKIPPNSFPPLALGTVISLPVRFPREHPSVLSCSDRTPFRPSGLSSEVAFSEWPSLTLSQSSTNPAQPDTTPHLARVLFSAYQVSGSQVISLCLHLPMYRACRYSDYKKRKKKGIFSSQKPRFKPQLSFSLTLPPCAGPLTLHAYFLISKMEKLEIVLIIVPHRDVMGIRIWLQVKCWEQIFIKCLEQHLTHRKHRIRIGNYYYHQHQHRLPHRGRGTHVRIDASSPFKLWILHVQLLKNIYRTNKQ